MGDIALSKALLSLVIIPLMIRFHNDENHNPAPACILFSSHYNNNQLISFYMTIEIETPYDNIADSSITYITMKAIIFCRIVKGISRAEIILKEDDTMPVGRNKICKIDLSVSDGTLTILTRTDCFEKSFEQGLDELNRINWQQIESKDKMQVEKMKAEKITCSNN